MSIEVGEVFTGTVTNVADFGAFVSLPEKKLGLVHISEITSEFVGNIDDFLYVGQTVKVKVISISNKRKIALSIKQVEPLPRLTPNETSAREKYVPVPMANRPGDFEWTEKKNDHGSLEDMMHNFKKQSEEKMSDLKRGIESKRGTSRKRTK